MKKLGILLFALMIGFAAEAQINPHALGLRLGGGDAGGSEISYQHGLSRKTRFEADLGWRNSKYYDAFCLTGVHQWVFPIESGFQWFVGVGGQFGSWSWDDKYYNGNDDDGMWIAIAGQIGIEYQFSEVPLQIGIDARPNIGVVNSNSELGNWDVALSIRYCF
ncbi:hypothetical protein LX69_01917 [Breznakibacter xylanolyticus]|uniref:Outer membrane protein with beta-barrel domain n=1 Tax=Breznakibacter xylanolyticus TaxID=990 RepID=A0A2W7NYZ8_9BACT|nr:hypothetical protein [Breznakibacter xylanolyticus]MBN2742844.1 hypothetical protein [Marinilabiliaceae bacterium]PZX16422.1 hypothetical protein LX69_01917 [Breznakibacter xylanolyticus]